MKKIKKITSLLTVAVLICVLSMSAFAHEIPDASQKGSITITMKDGDSIISGGTLTLYKVGEVKEEDGNYSFELLKELKASGVSLENLEAEELAQDIAEYAKEQASQKQTKEVNKEGKAEFTNLEIGLYLIAQEEPAEGYEAINPFLVTVPINEDGSYVYDVDASPKVTAPEKVPETTTEEPTTEEPTKQPGKPSLPLTGQLNWPIPVLVIAGFALVFIGFILKNGEKKGKSQS